MPRPKLPEPSVRLGDDGRPVWVRLPSVEDVQSVLPSDPEGVAWLSRLMSSYGWDSPSELRRQQVQYLSRFGITSESSDYAAQMERLKNESMAARVVVATARRVQQQAELQAAVGGNLDMWCVCVNDGDDPCPACLALSGEDHPYSWFATNGALPGDRCYGGDNCRCILVPYERD